MEYLDISIKIDNHVRSYTNIQVNKINFQNQL